MANRVTGSTDTTGALTTLPTLPKSALVVGSAGDGASEDFDPNVIYDILGTADAASMYGSSSKVVQMVKILIQNGVDNIKGIILAEDDPEDDDDDVLADALEVSMQDKTIKCIVTDTNDTATITTLKTHLAACESNDMFRYAFLAPPVAQTDTQAKLIAWAATVASDRIFVPGPAGMNDNASATVDPQVLAAGLAGVIMSETNDPALPLNGVPILGLGGISRVLLDTEKNALVAGGVVPLYAEGTTPTIYRLVTSKAADPIWQEGTTRFIADVVLETIEAMLRANYKRTKNVIRILNAIKDDVIISLTDFEAKEIIENFDPATVTVSKDPSDAYGALVDYEFDVVTPLYTITITQHMKL